MTNILIEGDHIPSYDMTAIAFERYSKILPINVRSVISRHISYTDLIWCDIFICVRGNNPLSLYLCRQAKKNGCKIILMLDDDLLNYTFSEHQFYGNLCKKSLRSIIKLADIILTPSKYLGEKYEKLYEINYVTTDTFIDNKDIKENWGKGENIRIVYAASHTYSFLKLIVPNIDKLYGKYGDKISLTVIGGKFDTTDIKMPITFVESMPYPKYREYMKNHSFDIGLAPLIETEMTKSKYFNKYLEYSSQGICGIYSNNLPYDSIVRDSKNGILADNDQESWFNALCKLIDDNSLRKRCVEDAESELINRFSIYAIGQKLQHDIPWLTTFKRSKRNQLNFKMPSYPVFLALEFMRRSLKLFSK